MLKKLFNKHFYIFLYPLIILSSILDFRLILLTPNLNYARIIIVCINLLFLFYITFYKSNKKLNIDKLFLTLLGYSIYKSFSLVFAFDKFDSLLNTVFWFNLSLFYLTLTNINFKFNLKKIYKIILVGGLFNALVASLQALFFITWGVKFLNIYGWKFPYGFRVTGLSFDANHLAAYILISIFISLYFVIYNSSYFYRFLSLLSFLFLLVNFYFSASRSAFLGLVFGLLSFGLYTILKNRFLLYKKFIYLFVSAIPLIFVLVAVFFMPLLNASLNNQLGAINDIIFNATKYFVKHGRGLDPSAFAHFSLIYASVYLMQSNWFFGTGAGNFSEGLIANPYLNKVFSMVDPDVLSKQEFPSHSMYGEALAEGGVVGIILFLLILILILQRYLNLLKLNKIYLPLFVYFFSVCFFMLFYNINEEFFWIFVFLGLVIKKQINTYNH